MDTLKQLFLVTLLLLPTCLLAKPMPPVQLIWLTPNVSLQAEATRVRAQMTASQAVSEVELHLELPAGVTLVEGDASWKGAMAAGEKKVFEFMLVRQGNVSGEVHLHAELPASQGDYHAHAIFSVNPVKRGKALSGGEPQWRDGRQIKAFVLP